MHSTRNRTLLALAVIAVAFVAWRIVRSHGADSAVGRLRAQGLPTTPEELDRWYQAVAPSENLANAILDASHAYRIPRDTNTPYVGRNPRAIPPHPVDPALVATWNTALTNCPEVFQSLEKARGRTASRYPINLRAGLLTLLPHLSQIKALAQFLALATLVHAESDRADDAVRDVRDILLVARSLEPEPTEISQLVRIAVLRIGVGAAATSLPRARVDAGSWKLLQADFARAESPGSLFTGLVGEATFATAFFESSPQGLAAWGAPTGVGLGSAGGTGSTALGQIGAVLYVASGMRAVDEDFCLRRLGERIEASRRPFPEALALADASAERVNRELAGPARGFKPISSMLLPGIEGSFGKHAECVAALRSAVAGCAIERHRLAHGGALPGTLAELVPAYLDAVPTDPFDGKPLRYVHAAGNYTVYSVGRDRADDGGEPQTTGKGTKHRATWDVGFRVEQRRP